MISIAYVLKEGKTSIINKVEWDSRKILAPISNDSQRRKNLFEVAFEFFYRKDRKNQIRQRGFTENKF